MDIRGRKGSFAHVCFRAEYYVMRREALLFFYQCIFGIVSQCKVLPALDDGKTSRPNR